GGGAALCGPGRAWACGTELSVCRLMVHLSREAGPGPPPGCPVAGRTCSERRAGKCGGQPAAFVASSTSFCQAWSAGTEPSSTAEITCSTAFFTWVCFTPRKTGCSSAADLAKISPLGASLKYSSFAFRTDGSCWACVLLGMLPA